MERAQRTARAVAVLLIGLAVLLSGCTPFWAQSKTTSQAQKQNGCPAWEVPPAAAVAGLPADATPSQIAAHNASLVLQTPRPLRNPYDLAQRLTGRPASAITCRVRTTPRNEKVGTTTTFYIVNASQSGYHQISARLAYVTPHLYMYVQPSGGQPVDETAVRVSADRFEQLAYVKDRQYFGEQWPTGPDSDPHITVLNSPEIPFGGYFSAEDEYPNTVMPFSNERQMVYINNSPGLEPGTANYDLTLAHEFQHMIHWYWHPGDPSWVNEGMSVLAQHVNGYSTSLYDGAFLQRPGTMLGGWTDDQNENIAHYGAGYLFNDYFAEHYGGYAVLKELLTSPQQTPLNFDAVLAAHGYKDRFDDVFAHFVVANFLNMPGLANGLYAYPTIPGQTAVAQHDVASYPFADGSAAQPAAANQYSAQYYDFQPARPSHTLNLDFSGAPTVGIVDNQPYGGAAAEWWSNSGNNMDSTLTRAFDLRPLAGKPATLTFRAWYDLESEFDYAYVDVSTDAGKTWTPLRSTSSTDANPNGSNFGHGLTGMSGGGSNPVWAQERVDLSPYAGKQILVRFETVTDDAVHYPGLALDDLSIPELGFADDVSGDNGWQAHGWIRSNNVLPEHYVLQAIVWTAGQPAPTVQRVAVNDDTGAARVSFPGFGANVTRVVLVVSPLAPATIVPAPYRLSATLG